MDFGEAVATCFRKYFTFRGRAVRSEFWFFYLFTVIVGAILGSLEMFFEFSYVLVVIQDIFSFATFIPMLSVGARRLHDIGKSGWWQILPYASVFLFSFYLTGMAQSYDFMAEASFNSFLNPQTIVIAGIMVLSIIRLIVWLATDSEKGPNRFGESPKYGSLADTFE